VSPVWLKASKSKPSAFQAKWFQQVFPFAFAGHARRRMAHIGPDVAAAGDIGSRVLRAAFSRKTQTCRLSTGSRLVEETRLPMTRNARKKRQVRAAGFPSLR
jgi:hypothetical protein